MRLRSVFALDPAAPNFEAALASSADAILVTVADARVDIDQTRLNAVSALEQIANAGKKGLVQVNHPRTQLLRGDIDVLVPHHLAGVIITGVTEPQDVRDTAVLLRELELKRDVEPGSVEVFPVVGTARAVLRAAEITEAVQRQGGIVFDPYAYAADIGARAEERGHRFSFARGAVIAACRATDRLPLVIAEGLELRDLAHHGFAGALVSDERSVAQANAAFAPTDSEKRRAEAHIAAYEAARAKGDWVARVGTEIVDASAARRARQTLE
jgi:citrate lyase beta subunit